MPRNFSTEELVRIATARFEPMNRGEQPLPYREIKKLINREGSRKVDEVALSTAVKEAITQRLVKVTVGEDFSPPARDEPLEEALLARYGDSLRTALVVQDARTPDGADQSPGVDAGQQQSAAPQSTEQKGRATDVTSKHIGVLLGNYLSESRIVRPGMGIGIGSGTAVLHTCQQVELRRRIAEPNLTLYSLTGAFGHRSAEDQNTLMDSDDNAAAFGRGVTYPCEFQRLRTLVILPRHGREVALADTWLGRPDVKEPAVLLVGAGAFSQLWSFYDALGQDADPDVKERMRELGELVQKIRAENEAIVPAFTPVGDIGCRLIRPPKDEAKISVEDDRRLDELVCELNDRLCTVEERWLFGSADEQIPLWLAAGSAGYSARKARVIHFALTRCRVDTFVTNAMTARALLRLKGN